MTLHVILYRLYLQPRFIFSSLKVCWKIKNFLRLNQSSKDRKWGFPHKAGFLLMIPSPIRAYLCFRRTKSRDSTSSRLSWPSVIYLWWCFFTFISTTCNKNRSKWQLMFQTALTAQRSQVSPRQRAEPSFRTIYQHTWWHQHQPSLWLAVCMSELIRRGQQVFECEWKCATAEAC